MELKCILCALGFLILGIAGAVSGAEDACKTYESINVNNCLLSFVVAHQHHQSELVSSKTCRVDLLNCSTLSETNTCINNQHLSDRCIDSLEAMINGYIANLQINCTARHFNMHCPAATKVSKEISSAVSRRQEQSCVSAEVQNINKCLLEFAMAHGSKKPELDASRTCRLDLLNCTVFSETNTCINNHHLSAKCIDSLDDRINHYIGDLNIKCTVSQFKTHCPRATKVSKEASSSATASDPTSSTSFNVASFAGLACSIMLSLLV
ncbi:uncharacterized protein [Haliotis cracherodii]|uniref:uncharacterized protein n=1 Tax=Haliotis cracherodii TaxID=6455 RepID=UPI0039EC6894